MAEERPKKFTSAHYSLMKNRGLRAQDYIFVKDTYGCLYIKHKVTGAVKIINKNN